MAVTFPTDLEIARKAHLKPMPEIAARMGEPGARPRYRHIEGWFRHDGAVARWSGAFLRRWLAGWSPGALPGRLESSNRQDSAADP